jgi:peptide chain release factor subunit 1
LRPSRTFFQLARLVDEHETAVVAVVDSNTSRLFVTRRGVLHEVGGIDADSKYFRTRPMMGGLNQASYQRHNAALRAQFARETATELARFVDTEAASRVVLAGDEVAIPLLRDALSPQVGFGQGRAAVGYSGPLDSVADDVKQVLAAAEAEDGQTTADLLVGAVRAGGLGVAGLDDTRVAQVGFPVVSDERRPLIGSI